MAKLKSGHGHTKVVKTSFSPTTTATAPDGTQGDLYYDSDKGVLMAYNTSWQEVSRATGAGGTETTYTGYKVHTFTASSTAFTVTGGSLTCDIVVVGGGGGASFGGGGAGALSWDASRVLTAGEYTVTVGAGGAYSTNGVTSSFGSSPAIVAVGGGRGGGPAGNPGEGAAGGSGGGGGHAPGPEGAAGTTSGSVGDNVYVGNGSNGGSHWGGGGGGAGGNAPSDGSDNDGSSGGVGHSTFVGEASTTSALLWAAQIGTNSANVLLTSGTVSSDPGTSYLAGGGGGAYGEAAGGAGGGAVSQDTGDFTGTPAPPNTGGGGGGMNGQGDGATTGGSGVVILRYAN